LSALQLLEELQKGRSDGGPLDWDIPSINLEEWKEGMTPSQVLAAEAQMQRISRKIHISKDGEIAGHWYRHERQHRRLHKLFPTCPYVQMVGDGHSFSMTSIPPQPPLPQPKLQQADLRILTLCVMSWVMSSIAKPISCGKWQQFKDGKRRLFYLHMFLVKKLHKTGYYDKTRSPSNVLDVWRPCLNAKPLNPFMQREYYKQASDPEIDATVERGSFTARTDVWGAFTQFGLSDAPLKSALSEDPPSQASGKWRRHQGKEAQPFGLTSSRDLCCFKIDHLLKYAKAAKWKEAIAILEPAAHKGMQAQVGMFGLSPMPVYWQKAYRKVNEHVQTKGVNLVTVMDDNMLSAVSVSKLLQDLETLTDLHIFFGVALSYKEPAALVPARVTVFNGFLYCTALMIKACPPSKLASIMWTLRQVVSAHRQRKRVTGSFLAKCAGQMADITKAMFGVRMFTQHIMQNLKQIIKAPLDEPLNRKALFSQKGYVTKAAMEDALKLLDHRLAHLNGRTIIHGQKTDEHVTTDWSGYGWGAVLQPTQSLPKPPILSVQFPDCWRNMWSGSGELLTGGWAIMAFGNEYGWRNKIILLCMDNVFAICTYNKMGSKDPAINAEMEFFWEWCRRRRNTVVASYIPGILIVADEPSRRRAGLWEFELAMPIYLALCKLMIASETSPLQAMPTFDLCATHINTKATKFASLHPDPFCSMVNCLVHPLRQLAPEVLYAFPPPKILTRLLAKVREEQITVLLVCVAWKRTFLPLLADGLVSIPIMIPWTSATVLDPHLDYGPVPEDEETRLNDQQVWEKWLLCGCMISGDNAVRQEYRTKLQATSSSQWLDSQPLLSYTNDGVLTAKAWAWLALLQNIVCSSTR
jgi:hypothetical protein